VKIRILVVDDEQDNCDYLKLLLTREGFEVTTLTDPRQTVDLLKKTDYHLVILDMMMPQMSGTEVLKQIRKVDSDVAVIIATAYPTVLARKGLSSDPEADLHRAIGITIRDARKHQGLTLKQLARRTGLSVSLLSQIERAESSASISSLYKIASALRITMPELFGGPALRRVAR